MEMESHINGSGQVRCDHESVATMDLTSEHQSCFKHDLPFDLLACSGCGLCVRVKWRDGDDEGLEEALGAGQSEEDRPDGWHLAETVRDKQRHLLLNLGVYRQTASHADYESDFDLPHQTEDIVLLAWRQNVAVGFATVKSCADLVVIDSIFVRQSHRRQGLASDLVKKLLNVQKCPGDDNIQKCDSSKACLLGLSQPVSTSMLLVTLRILKSHPEHRNRVVLLDDNDGSRGNLWWSAIKICKDRNIMWK